MDYRILELSPLEKLFFYLISGAFLLSVGWLFYDSIKFSLPLGFLIIPAKKYYIKILKEKRKSKLTIQFRDLLYSISSFISSGRSLGQSLTESIDFWRGTYDDKDMIIIELRWMTKRMTEGKERDVDVLRNFAERSDIRDIEDLVMVCDTCKNTGGNFTAAVNKCADIIGDKISLEKDLKMISSQKMFEGRIVAITPFLIIFFIKILSPEYMMALSYTNQGRVISTIALIMIICSFILIERMNDIEL